MSIFCSREETTRVRNCLQPQNWLKFVLKENFCFHATAISRLANSVQGAGDDCPFDEISISTMQCMSARHSERGQNIPVLMKINWACLFSVQEKRQHVFGIVSSPTMG